METPQRKPNRLAGFDYSNAGAYHIIICTSKRRSLFWENVGATIGRLTDIRLSASGKIVDDVIREISEKYPAVTVDQYIIMPDHVHLLIQIHMDTNGMRQKTPSIDRIIQQMKGVVTKKIGFPIWQKGYYDHVVRCDADYLETWEYIAGNPGRWLEKQQNQT